MTLKDLGQIRTKSNLKTTVNLTLVDDNDFNIDKLKEYFDPKYFFIKLSPINKNEISELNNLGDGIIQGINLI
jgi:23S rRNA (adenine2503-C2)-methyltransferase